MSTQPNEPSKEEIAGLAEQIWEEEGRPKDRAEKHWLRAEALLRSAGDPATALNEISAIDPASIDIADPVAPADAEPEVAPGTEELTEWDTPPEATGHAAPKVALEDEVPPHEQAIAEGLEAADRDQRLAAADPDFEP